MMGCDSTTFHVYKNILNFEDCLQYELDVPLLDKSSKFSMSFRNNKRGIMLSSSKDLIPMYNDFTKFI